MEKASRNNACIGVKISQNIYFAPDIALRLFGAKEENLSPNPIFGKALVFDKNGKYCKQDAFGTLHYP